MNFGSDWITAASSPLGILALLILMAAIVGLAFFRRGPVNAQIGVFATFVVGALLYGLAAQRGHEEPKESPAPPASSSRGSTAENIGQIGFPTSSANGKSESNSAAGELVVLTRPDGQLIMISPSSVASCAAVPPQGTSEAGPLNRGTRITYLNGAHQDVKELPPQVTAALMPRFTRPDGSRTAVRPGDVTSASPVSPLDGPLLSGTRIEFSDGNHQDVKEKVGVVREALNNVHNCT